MKAFAFASTAALTFALLGLGMSISADAKDAAQQAKTDSAQPRVGSSSKGNGGDGQKLFGNGGDGGRLWGSGGNGGNNGRSNRK